MTSHPATQAQGRFPARTRIMNQAPSTGGAMPHPPSALRLATPTNPKQTQAQEPPPPRPHRKPPSARSTASASNPPDQTFPAERRSAVMERRERMVELDRMPRREQVYREEYSWGPFVERRTRPYPPPPVSVG